jgi:hypothetical protein
LHSNLPGVEQNLGVPGLNFFENVIRSLHLQITYPWLIINRSSGIDIKNPLSNSLVVIAKWMHSAITRGPAPTHLAMWNKHEKWQIYSGKGWSKLDLLFWKLKTNFFSSIWQLLWLNLIFYARTRGIHTSIGPFKCRNVLFHYNGLLFRPAIVFIWSLPPTC